VIALPAGREGRASRSRRPPRARIDEIEAELGEELPAALRGVLLGFSARVCIAWQLPKGARPPKPLDIFSGELSWDLERLPALREEYRQWLIESFNDPQDPYDAVWHDKFPFMPVGNGDYLAIDVASPENEEVVYLSHDDGEGHGYRLGESFADYIDRCTRLGCAGPEDWQWLPFTSDARSYLLPDCEKARAWRAWMKLSGEAFEA
jgi:hypothetical protein